MCKGSAPIGSSVTRLLTGAAVALLAVSWAGCSDAPGGESSSSDRPEGCFGKCDGTEMVFESEYVANLEKLSQIFPNDKAPLSTIADAFSVVVDLGQNKIKAPTHLFGADVQVIPYGDEDNVTDAVGNPVARFDSEIAKAYTPGIVGIGVKHHRPEFRYFSVADASADMKEHFKLQDTHIELVVGVQREGAPGAITINNPQTYQDGLFGGKTYPMMFLQATFPEYVKAQERAFNDNILNWLMVFGAVSEFPGDYNGGDPLAAYNSEKVLEHAINGIKAITGDTEAHEWFQKDENMIYCAELAYISHNAGILVPLTKAFMAPHVGEEVWAAYTAEVDKHNAGQPNAFMTMNSNDMIKYVRTTATPEDLQPLWTYAPADQQTDAKSRLAFAPMTASHIVEHFMRLTFPREELGEGMAAVQGGMLAKMKDGLLEQMGMDGLPAEHPARAAASGLYDKIVETVSVQYEDYTAFRKAIQPLLDQAGQLTGPRPGDNGKGYYVPPSLYHIIAQGKHPGGLLGVGYVGHGVHWSASQPKSAAPAPAPAPDPVPGPPVEDPLANSCKPTCGGPAASGDCYCDASCTEFNDCCADFAEYCSE